MLESGDGSHNTVFRKKSLGNMKKLIKISILQHMFKIVIRKTSHLKFPANSESINSFL
jgi:hypothetical protein